MRYADAVIPSASQADQGNMSNAAHPSSSAAPVSLRLWLAMTASIWVHLANLFAVTVALGIAITPAFAGGGGVIRDLSRTTIRACPKGHQLKEHYFVSADARSYAEDVEIACLRDPAFASWIFTAESVCENNERCLAIEKQLAFPREHANPARPTGAYTAPRVVTYKMSRYEIGKDCSLKSQRHLGDFVYFWSCVSQNSARLRKPIHVEAKGATVEMADNDDGAARLPFSVFTGHARPPVLK